MITGSTVMPHSLSFDSNKQKPDKNFIFLQTDRWKAESLNTYFQLSAARHKHLCPRQVLGVRMGILAGNRLALGLPRKDKRLITIVETDGCFVDGIEVTTGCTVGHQTLHVQDFGKVAAVFFDTATNDVFRIAPKESVREIANDYGMEGKNRWERQLLGYQRMPDDELFKIEIVKLDIPVSVMIGKLGVRVNCQVCGEEVINGRQINVGGQVLCRSCAGLGYYTADGVQHLIDNALHKFFLEQ